MTKYMTQTLRSVVKLPGSMIAFQGQFHSPFNTEHYFWGNFETIFSCPTSFFGCLPLAGFYREMESHH